MREGVMPVMRDIFSSTVNRAGHDPKTNELHVEWKTGKTSVYSNVPPKKADEVLNAWSVGKSLYKKIKGAHDHRYLK